MDKDIRNVLIVVAITAITIYLIKPKSKSVFSKNLDAPKIATNPEREYENAVTAIKAMRAAINAGESQEALNELNKEIISMYNLKVFTDENHKLIVRNKQKKAIAREE